MEQFDYIKFVNENPLMKETDGYGSYKNPKTMLEFDGQDDFFINVSVRDAKKALEILRDEFSNEIRSKIIQLDGSDSYVINDREVAMDLYDALKLQDIEIIGTDVEVDDYDFDGEDDDEFMEVMNKPLGPDEELMEDQGNPKVDEFVYKLKELTQKMARKLNDEDLDYLRNKLQAWADSGFQAASL